VDKVRIWQQEYNGWPHCVWMENGFIRLIVTVDVGPRIICFQRLTGKNVFYQFPQQQGLMNGDEWLNYGGHRLWHSPQVRFRPNQPDNSPVSWGVEGQTLWIMGNTEEKTLVQKRLEITMAEDAPSVRVRHAIINRSMWPVELATWALSVMQPEGTALLPVPQEDTFYLPNYAISFWPWTRPNDPRFAWGEKYFMLRQDPAVSQWFKLGYRNTEGWGAYFIHDCAFLKVAWEQPGETYPDYGSTFEVFADNEFLELESLGPLKTIQPDEAVSHEETWYLLDQVKAPENETDADARIVPIIMPYVKK